MGVLGPQEVTATIGRETTLVARRPARTQTGAVVLGPTQGGPTVTRPRGTTRSLASMEAIATFAVALPVALPRPVAVPRLVVVVAKVVIQVPSIAVPTLPSTRQTTATILLRTSPAIGVATTSLPQGLTLLRLPLAAVLRATALLASTPFRPAGVLATSQAKVATLVPFRPTRLGTETLLHSPTATTGRPTSACRAGATTAFVGRLRVATAATPATEVPSDSRLCLPSTGRFGRPSARPIFVFGEAKTAPPETTKISPYQYRVLFALMMLHDPHRFCRWLRL